MKGMSDSVLPSGKTRGNRHRLKQRKYILNMRKCLFTVNIWACILFASHKLNIGQENVPIKYENMFLQNVNTCIFTFHIRKENKQDWKSRILVSNMLTAQRNGINLRFNSLDDHGRSLPQREKNCLGSNSSEKR